MGTWEAPTVEMARPAPAVLRALEISPAPTDEEAAAIVAAAEALWPKPVLVVDEHGERIPTWRFSGRWWARPVAARRDRPWY
jgi:hypothetical protein